MTEKRFTKYVPNSYGYTYITTIIDNKKNKHTGNTDEIVDMLNELNDENEQLKGEVTYYKLLFESLQQYAKNFVEKHNKKGYKTTEKERDCGHCKNLQIDGMFGMWCEKDRDWTNTDAKYCPDYKR